MAESYNSCFLSFFFFFFFFSLLFFFSFGSAGSLCPGKKGKDNGSVYLDLFQADVTPLGYISFGIGWCCQLGHVRQTEAIFHFD